MTKHTPDRLPWRDERAPLTRSEGVLIAVLTLVAIALMMSVGCAPVEAAQPFAGWRVVCHGNDANRQLPEVTEPRGNGLDCSDPRAGDEVYICLSEDPIGTGYSKHYYDGCIVSGRYSPLAHGGYISSVWFSYFQGGRKFAHDVQPWANRPAFTGRRFLFGCGGADQSLDWTMHVRVLSQRGAHELLASVC